MSRSRLTVTPLEGRCLPAGWGNPWPDAAHLTLSFTPDGTTVGGAASQLASALGPAGDWQLAVLRAFQTWAVNANINVGLVADGGQPFGTGGGPQGDARFGDVRVGAVPLGAGEVGTGAPFDAMAGTWAGDVLLNTATGFSLGGGTGYDLYSVLLHEAGHVLGLGHSDDPGSVMFGDYLGPRPGPSAADVAALQALYGGRGPGPLEGAVGNDTLATATGLGLFYNSDGTYGLNATGDITTPADRDVFSFQSPNGQAGMAVRLRTNGVSLLTARVTVYDAAGQVVGSAANTDPRDGDIIVRIDSVTPQSTYYVAVEAARDDVFGVGSFTLRVARGSLANVPATALADWINQVATGAAGSLLAADAHANDTVPTATPLPQGGSPFDYAVRASVGDATDRDVYRVTAPAGGTVLTAMAWGTPTRGLLTADQHLAPTLTVYDAAGSRVAARVLVNDGYGFTVQVPDATPGADYYVEVAAGPAGMPVGNYFLGVDFGGTTAGLTTLSVGDLTTGAAAAADTLGVNRGGLFHFVLAADAAVAMTVTDAAGAVVFTLRAGGRDRVSGNVHLGPGRYAVTFAAADGPVRYSLRGARLSDPIGPEPVDPTENPSGTPTNDSILDWFYEWAMSDPDNLTGLPPVDPIGDPYVV